MPSYPPYNNPLMRSMNDNSGSTNIRSPMEQARFRRATELATAQLKTLRTANPSFADPIWDERLLALSEAIEKILEKQKSTALTAEELLALEQKQILQKMMKKDFDALHEQHSIIEQIRYGIDIARKTTQTNQTGSVDNGSRTSEFYLLKGVLDGTSAVQNAIATLRRDLMRRDISIARKDEIERTIGRLAGTLSRNVPEPAVRQRPIGEISGPITKPAPEEPKTTGRKAESTWQQRAESEAEKAFTAMEQRVIVGEEELFWEREREWVTKLINSRKMIAQEGSEKLRTEFELRKLKVLLGLIVDTLQQLHDRQEQKKASEEAMRKAQGIRVGTTRAWLPDVHKGMTVQSIPVPSGESVAVKKPKAERIPPRPVIDFGAIAKPQQEDQELPSGPDEEIFAMDEGGDHGGEEEVGGGVVSQIKIPVVQVRKEKKESGKVGIAGGGTLAPMSILKAGEEIPPQEIIEQERRVPVIIEKEPEIDLSRLQREGEARAEQDIKNLGALKEIYEFVDGLSLHLYGEHEQLDLLRDYAEDMVDVSDYKKPLSAELLKKMEEDAKKLIKKTNFREKFALFFKEKVRLEALEKYLLSHPIPVENAEEYLGVAPHANRKAVDLVHARLLQGLDVEKNAREITALHEARRKALLRVEKEEKEAEEAKAAEEKRQQSLDVALASEKPKSKDLAELMEQKMPARKWYETVPGILGGIGAAVAVALGVQKADELLNRPTAELQTKTSNVPKAQEKIASTTVHAEQPAAPIIAPVSAPKSLEQMPTPSPKPIVIEASPASNVAPVVAIEKPTIVSPSLKPEAVSPRDFTTRSLVVEKGDTVDDIWRNIAKARGVTLSQTMRNFIYHQIITENNLREQKNAAGETIVIITPGQTLSLEGAQDTVDTLLKKTSSIVTPSAEAAKSLSIALSSSWETPSRQSSDTGLIIASSLSSSAESSDAISPASHSSETPKFVQTTEQGADRHIYNLKERENVWKLVHNRLRDRGLNWTSERINFLTQIVLDDSAPELRRLFASGEMKAWKDTAIPSGARIDFTIADAIMDGWKAERAQGGKSKTIADTAKQWGRMWKGKLEFPKLNP